MISENDIKKELEKAIDSFSRNDNQTETFFPIINGKKYFIKVAGKLRGKYKDNEVDSLIYLSKISSFYSKYYISSMSKDGKTAILLEYIEGTDMYEMLKTNEKWSEEFLIKLYKLLLSKVRFYHNHLLTHGDIKATNFYIHACSKENENEEIVDIDLIDTESVNNFNKDQRKKNGKFINFISTNYDFPVKLKRGNIHFYSHKNAFLFYKYLDIYSTSVLILYLYKPHVYQMLKKRGDNSWKIGKKQRRPTEYVQKQSNQLEKALYYVFSFLSYVEKEGEMIRVEDIPISHTKIIEILEKK